MKATRIRPGRIADRTFVRRLSAEVFSRFGDYERLLPPLLAAESVRTIIVEVEGAPAGFAMVEVPSRTPDGGDLIAIAVEPRWQRSGLGKELLRRVEQIVRASAAENKVAWMWLTVAEDNLAARRMFEAASYEVVDRDHGRYEGGQRSIGMRKLL
jgi:ribosomal protein S18 acetylase RimI-like enzyme